MEAIVMLILKSILEGVLDDKLEKRDPKDVAECMASDASTFERMMVIRKTKRKTIKEAGRKTWKKNKNAVWSQVMAPMTVAEAKDTLFACCGEGTPDPQKD